MNEKIAIISGTGALPQQLAETCHADGGEYCVVVLKGTELNWLDGHSVITGRVEKTGKLLSDLKNAGVSKVIFAGAVTRPKINPLKLDQLGMKLAADVLGASKKGDDETLRYIIDLFEENGFSVIAPTDLVPDLLPMTGILTKKKPSDLDKKDAERALNIAHSLGNLDVGQGAVVAGGTCLGLESIQGTDKMLKFVADTRRGKGGVLLKAAKPTQDLRVDMPAIGVNTVRNAHDAKLSGIVIESGSVMVLGLEDVIATANKIGLFVWVR